jgi:hypothetical protein
MSEEEQKPISHEQYFRNNADALADEHTRAMHEYREATRALRTDALPTDDSNKISKAELELRNRRRLAAEVARKKLDEVESRMAKKAAEAEKVIGPPESPEE